MKYLVTGGAGFIGSAITARLIEDGHEVRVLDDFSRGHKNRIINLPCEIRDGDIRNPELVENAVHGCDSILHLAYMQGTVRFYTSSKPILDVAIRGISNVLNACERLGVSELLLVSSSEVYQTASIVPTPETVPLLVPDPHNPRFSYGGGKIAGELMSLAWAREGVLDRLIIVRPHNIYGPDMGREHVIPEFCTRMNGQTRKFKDGVIPFPIQGSGEETRSFCYIKDCVDQITLLLRKAPAGAEIYHVGTQDEDTIYHVACQIAFLYGREIKVLPGTLQKGSPPRRVPDTSKIESLGWQSANRTTFAHGLENTVEWYKQND